MAWEHCDTYKEGLFIKIKLYRSEDREHLRFVVEYNMNTFELVCKGTFLRIIIEGKRYFAYSVSTIQDTSPFRIYVDDVSDDN